MNAFAKTHHVLNVLSNRVIDHGQKVGNVFLADLRYKNFDVTLACFPPFFDVLEDFSAFWTEFIIRTK